MTAVGALGFHSEDKYFASTEGSSIQQYILQVYPTLNATAVDFKNGVSRTKRSGSATVSEWTEEALNRSNQKKHAGIDFETASHVFADPNLILRKDRVFDGEQRWHALGLFVGRCCWQCICIVRRAQMAKKSSASSRSGKQIRVSAESIWSKPLTKRQKITLDGVATRQKRADVSEIDYSDIPKLSDKQLAEFRRPPKRLVAVRLGADVFEWLRQFGPGYSTRINNVLRVVMSRGQ